MFSVASGEPRSAGFQRGGLVDLARASTAGASSRAAPRVRPGPARRRGSARSTRSTTPAVSPTMRPWDDDDHGQVRGEVQAHRHPGGVAAGRRPGEGRCRQPDPPGRSAASRRKLVGGMGGEGGLQPALVFGHVGVTLRQRPGPGCSRCPRGRGRRPGRLGWEQREESYSNCDVCRSWTIKTVVESGHGRSTAGRPGRQGHPADRRARRDHLRTDRRPGPPARGTAATTSAWPSPASGCTPWARCSR